MGRMKESPRYHVVSLRISDEEQDSLREITRCTKMTVSQVLRAAISLLPGRETEKGAS